VPALRVIDGLGLSSEMVSGAEGVAATTMRDLCGARTATLSEALTGILNVGRPGAFAIVIGLWGLAVVSEVCTFFVPGGSDAPSAERVRRDNGGHCNGACATARFEAVATALRWLTGFAWICGFGSLGLIDAVVVTCVDARLDVPFAG
jgi:hypothetical protein